jgi:predicted Zn-dependent peptidase
MEYIQLTPFIHLLIQPMDRQKVELETILTSGGSWFEEAADRGKKHLLEHCIVSRTANMDYQQLKDFTFRENIYLNAYTGSLSMGFEASGHHGDFRKIAQTLLELTFAPNFHQTDLDREKEIVLREISERRGDPNYKLHFDVQKNVFTPKSLENHEVLGDPQKVEATTLPDFERLYKQNTDLSHLLITVSGGGIDLEFLKNLVLENLSRKNEYTKNLEDSEHKKALDFNPQSQLLDFRSKSIVHELAHEHADLNILLPCPINFENRPVLAIFQNLFLRYGGVMHDRLRDELGLVYGLQGNFYRDLQMLSLNMSCEIQYINQIVGEVRRIMSDYDQFFNPTKFNEFRGIVKKKEDIAADTLGTTVNHAVNTLRTYGILEQYSEYSQKLDQVSTDDFRNLYESMQAKLNDIRLVTVSRDPAIEKISL